MRNLLCLLDKMKMYSQFVINATGCDINVSALFCSRDLWLQGLKQINCPCRCDPQYLHNHVQHLNVDMPSRHMLLLFSYIIISF